MGTKKKCNRNCQCHDCCGCQLELPADCVRWYGKPIPELGIKHGDRLESIIKKIADYLKNIEVDEQPGT